MSNKKFKKFLLELNSRQIETLEKTKDSNNADAINEHQKWLYAELDTLEKEGVLTVMSGEYDYSIVFSCNETQREYEYMSFHTPVVELGIDEVSDFFESVDSFIGCINDLEGLNRFVLSNFFFEWLELTLNDLECSGCIERLQEHDFKCLDNKAIYRITDISNDNEFNMVYVEVEK